MSLYKQIDFVLIFISVTPFEKGGMTDEFILSKVQPVVQDGNELHQILNQLIKDGYLHFEDRVLSRQRDLYSLDKVDYTVRYYHATFGGRLFSENGGYENKKLMEDSERSRYRDIELKAKANRKTVTFLTWIIALGTFVAALYYALEIWKHFHQTK